MYNNLSLKTPLKADLLIIHGSMHYMRQQIGHFNIALKSVVSI